ncbi:MAG: TraB/GumN family protein [Pseudomonadales bacterium]
MRVLKVTLLAFLIAWMSPLFAEVTLDDLASTLQLEFDKETRDSFAPLLKTYQKARGNKALAFATADNGEFVIGLGYEARSEIGAGGLAIQQCQNTLKQHDLSGECEVLVLGEQILMPGAILRQGVNDDTPAMAWKIDGPNGDMYLLGTVHVLKPTLFPMPKVFDVFFAEADSIVFEINPILQTDPARQTAAAEMMNADPKQQKPLYDRKTRKLIKRYLKTQGIPMESLYTAKPVVNALQVTQLKTAAMGYSLASGIETHYARQASVEGKPIGELETTVEALQALFSLSPELQVRLLVDTILQLDDVAPGIEVLVRQWMLGDAERVYLQTVEDLVAEPAFAHVATGILDTRNELWMEKLKPLLEAEGDEVVMVGTAHFGGERGLLNLFRERGYEPVQYTWGGEPVTAQAD